VIPRRFLDPRAALRALPLALGASTLLGVISRAIGVSDWRQAFGVPAIFTVVMWVGFELFGPCLAFHPDERLSPGAMAIREELKSVGLYTALLTVAVVLCLLTTGVNPVQDVPSAIITYLIGFCITSIVGSFHTTSSLARAAQERARAEVARLTLEAENARKTQELEEARAQIVKTEALIEQKLIRAPFSGQLGVRQIEVGQYLTPGAPIVTLTDLSTLYVNFTLPGRQRPEIKVGQQVAVRSDAFPGRAFDAKITTIEPQISADTRTMMVQATMQNPDDALLPGMFIDAQVVLPPQPDMLVLPATAVEYTLYGDSVFVIRDDGKDANGQPILKAVRTPVKTGARWDQNVAILDGLKPGERVVSAGQVKVQNGTQVKIGSPAPAPPANPTLN